MAWKQHVSQHCQLHFVLPNGIQMTTASSLMLFDEICNDRKQISGETWKLCADAFMLLLQLTWCHSHCSLLPSYKQIRRRRLKSCVACCITFVCDFWQYPKSPICTLKTCYVTWKIKKVHINRSSSLPQKTLLLKRLIRTDITSYTCIVYG